MGGSMSRSKGQRGEREVIKLLQPIINKAYEEAIAAGIVDGNRELPVLERNLMQTAKGGFDIVGLKWLALEVKYQETDHLNQWWEQTLEQAKGRSVPSSDGPKIVGARIPILIYRKNNVKWNVMMYGSLLLSPGDKKTSVRAPVIVPLDTFLTWFYHKIRLELGFDYI